MELLKGNWESVDVESQWNLKCEPNDESLQLYSFSCASPCTFKSLLKTSNYFNPSLIKVSEGLCHIYLAQKVQGDQKWKVWLCPDNMWWEKSWIDITVVSVLWSTATLSPSSHKLYMHYLVLLEERGYFSLAEICVQSHKKFLVLEKLWGKGLLLFWSLPFTPLHVFTAALTSARALFSLPCFFA